MKKVFVRTQNVKNFINLMNNIQNRAEGVPGLALVYGEPGLGKTQALLWWALQNDAAFVRCTNLMTGKWFLETLVEELGEVPFYRTIDLFKQCVQNLNNNPRVLIVDEIDYLATDRKAIERDTYISILINNNMPLEQIKELLGYYSLNRVYKRYKCLLKNKDIDDIFRPYFRKSGHSDDVPDTWM